MREDDKPPAAARAAKRPELVNEAACLIAYDAQEREVIAKEINERCVDAYSGLIEWEQGSRHWSELYRQIAELRDWLRTGDGILRSIAEDDDFYDFLFQGKSEFQAILRGIWHGREQLSLEDLIKILGSLRQLSIQSLDELNADKPGALGGGGGLFKEQMGSAKHTFVKECVDIFGDYTDELAATEGGKLWKFVGLVFEAATGQEPDETGAGLRRYINFSVKYLKQIKILNGQLIPLEIAAMNAPQPMAINEEIERLREQFEKIARNWQRGPKAPPRKGRSPAQRAAQHR